jgi:hypothetical protein
MRVAPPREPASARSDDPWFLLWVIPDDLSPARRSRRAGLFSIPFHTPPPRQHPHKPLRRGPQLRKIPQLAGAQTPQTPPQVAAAPPAAFPAPPGCSARKTPPRAPPSQHGGILRTGEGQPHDANDSDLHIIGCTQRKGLARKSPAAAGLSRVSSRACQCEQRQTHRYNTTNGCTARGRTRKKKPRQRGAGLSQPA